MKHCTLLSALRQKNSLFYMADMASIHAASLHTLIRSKKFRVNFFFFFIFYKVVFTSVIFPQLYVLRMCLILKKCSSQWNVLKCLRKVKLFSKPVSHINCFFFQFSSQGANENNQECSRTIILNTLFL